MAVAIKKGEHRNDFVTEHWHQQAREIQKFGDVVKDLPHPLDEKVRSQMCARLNQLLADLIALRDMYKKHHCRLPDRRSTICTFCSISTSTSSWRL